jgi:hypothetical protein
MSVLSVLDVSLKRLRPKSKVRCVIASLIAVPALAACGSAEPSHRVDTSKTDAHWSVLHNCAAQPPENGGWLAISNVAYFFSLASTPAEVDRVTSCLTKAYPGKPKWPANVSLSTLSSPESPYT